MFNSTARTIFEKKTHVIVSMVSVALCVVRLDDCRYRNGKCINIGSQPYGRIAAVEAVGQILNSEHFKNLSKEWLKGENQKRGNQWWLKRG